MNPLDELEQFFAAAVRTMPTNIFDSHAFILELVRHPPRQRLYVRAMSATDGDDPFRQINRQIATRLKKHTDLVRPLGKVTSNNIFGYASPNEQWERR